jgi:F0F1-type ATP synthase membrane subunit b/b'
MLDNAAQRTAQFTSDLTTTIEHHTNLFQSNLTHIMTTARQQIDLKIKEINHHLDTTIQSSHEHLKTTINNEVETAVQEIHDITDSATQTFTDHIKTLKIPSNQEKPNHPTKHRSTLYSKCGSRTLHGHKTTSPTQPLPI